MDWGGQFDCDVGRSLLLRGERFNCRLLVLILCRFFLVKRARFGGDLLRIFLIILDCGRRDV